jgi:hypothetical protein
MQTIRRYLPYLLGGCVAVLICSPAHPQAWRYDTGEPDLVFVSNSLRLVRDGETVRRLERPGPVMVEVEIQNAGPGVARDIIVRVDDNGVTAVQQKLPILVAGASQRILLPWNATRGPHHLTISIDPEQTIREAKEDNNVAIIEAPVPRLVWPILLLIVVLALGAGALAGYAAWRLWAPRPMPPTPPAETPPDAEAEAEKPGD